MEIKAFLTVKQVADYISQGMSAKEIAELNKMSLAPVYKKIKQAKERELLPNYKSKKFKAISPEKRGEVVRLIKTGYTRVQINSETGLSVYIINRIADEEGLIIKAEKAKKVSPEKRGEVVRLIKAGYTVTQIMKETKKSCNAINKIANEEGLIIRDGRESRWKVSEEKREEVIELIKAGHTVTQIMRETKKSCATINKIADEEGLTIRDGRQNKNSMSIVNGEQENSDTEMQKSIYIEIEQLIREGNSNLALQQYGKLSTEYLGVRNWILIQTMEGKKGYDLLASCASDGIPVEKAKGVFAAMVEVSIRIKANSKISARANLEPDIEDL